MSGSFHARRLSLRLLITLALLMLPVPWLAPLWLQGSWLGLPLWLFYSMGGTLLFSLITALLLQIAWHDE